MNLRLLLNSLRPNLIVTMDFGDGVRHKDIPVFELTELLASDPNGFASSYPEEVRSIREDDEADIALVF